MEVSLIPAAIVHVPLVRRAFCPSSAGGSWRRARVEGQGRTLSGVGRAVRLCCSRAPAGAAMARSVDVKRGVQLKVYKESEKLAQDLADYVADLSASAIREHGAFSVALSGGSLISSLGKLSEEPCVGKIDWAKWHVFWADERVVPLDHPDSNYKLAYDGLLSKLSIPAGQVHAINDKLSPQAAAAEYELGLRELVKTNVLSMSETGDFPRLDLILLGIGPDGHTASLFPQHPLLSKTEVWIASLEDSPKPPPERITFTLPLINSGANVAFVTTGAGKAAKMKQIFGKPLPFGELPAQLVDPFKGNLVWFADEAAVADVNV